MADKSSLRKKRMQIIDDILWLFYEANGVFHSTDDNEEFCVAASTINFCKNLLSQIDV